MTMPARDANVTEDEAQRLHEQRQSENEYHDRSSCWCCCEDCCDFDIGAIFAQRKNVKE